MALRRDPVQWMRSALAGRGSDTDLPVADLLALRAGLQAGGGVGEVVRGLGTSTAPALRQMAVAVDCGTSLAAQADAPSAGPLVRALAVAEVSGSSATPALGAILDAVTAEQRLRRLVDARSAQALMTARMLVILPVLAAAAISLGDPGSRGFLASEPGVMLTTTAGAMIALAAWWMRRLVAGVGRAVAATDPLHPGRSRPRILLARRGAAWRPGRRAHPACSRSRAGLDTVEAIELLAMALASGFSPQRATGLVALLGPPGVRPRFERATAALHAGVPITEALGAELSEVARMLQTSQQFGAPAAPSLRLLAADLRDRAAFAAEVAAERLTVQLVFPTTLLLVPAFGLLVVVPLVASAFSGLRLGP